MIKKYALGMLFFGCISLQGIICQEFESNNDIDSQIVTEQADQEHERLSAIHAVLVESFNTLQELYKRYEDGGRVDEFLKNEIQQLAITYCALKNVYSMNNT